MNAEIQMNVDLRVSIVRICSRLSAGVEVHPDELNHVCSELKKITSYALCEDDHLLYMQFYYELGKRETFTIIHRLPHVDYKPLTGWYDTVQQQQRADKADLLKKYGLFATETTLYYNDEKEPQHLLVAEESPAYNK
jgi:hypothetical protein